MQLPNKPSRDIGPAGQEDLVGVGIRELIELQESFESPWKGVIRTERIRRERILDGLRTYHPDRFEMPEYGQDPDSYLAQARATNRSPVQLIDTMKSQHEMQTATDLAVHY